MRISDWSSDVCSSDLKIPQRFQHILGPGFLHHGQQYRETREQKQDQRLSRVAQKEVGEHCGKQQRQHRLAKHLERNPPWRALLLPRKLVRPIPVDRKSTRLKSSHSCAYSMPSFACKKKERS